MAEDASVAETVYSKVKARLLAGAFRYNERLDVAKLAQEHDASTTPVREALTRLQAERLIIAENKRGFFARLWSAADLRALYEWRGFLLQGAAAGAEAGVLAPDSALAYPDRVRAAFAAIEAGANVEARWAGANADDRLTRARAAEADLMRAQADLDALIAAFNNTDARARVRAVKAYHDKRVAAASQIRDRAVLLAVARNGQ